MIHKREISWLKNAFVKNDITKLMGYKTHTFMKKIHLFHTGLSLLVLLFILSSCSPKVATHYTSSVKYAALDFDKEVYVFKEGDALPPVVAEIGEIKISDTGFSTGCTYEQVVEKAKIEARKAGGNTLMITEHKLPTAMGSTCHRIKATILITNPDSAFIAGMNTSSIEGENYALLYVYRFPGPGSLLNYDLHLGDSVICRIRNNFSDTIPIYKEGLNSLWAETETRTEIPVDIEFGKEYYVRCGVSFGILVGNPTIELVSPSIGKGELNALQIKKKK